MQTAMAEDVDDIIRSVGVEKKDLIPILQAIQRKFSYLPEEALRRIPCNTQITLADIEEVSSFYSQFRQKPSGKHFIRVCVGTACHVKGAESVYDAFRKHLGIQGSDDTDGERLFTVEKIACLGCCMLAPAVQIDDLIYGHLDSSKIQSVIDDFLKSAQSPPPSEMQSSIRPTKLGEIRICQCSSCSAAGSSSVYEEIGKFMRKSNLPFILKSTGCTGISYQAPLLEIVDCSKNIFRYGKVTKEQTGNIIARHFKPESWPGRFWFSLENKLKNILADDIRIPVIRYNADIRDKNSAGNDFLSSQYQIVTEGAGHLNPLDVDAYISSGGFVALGKSISDKSPEAVVDAVKESGLRGRGGAGFPTGEKWASLDGKRQNAYIICNGDEGDPGAFMDRMILESFPFRVLEGVIIASYAIGVSQSFIYIRAEYPLALARISEAIKICESRGLLGDDILGSGYNLKLEIIRGAGAFVCGEETALIASVEGRRGMPVGRPPYPSERGLYGKPTLINNVETFANIPWIIRNSPEKFKMIGTEKSPGTKTFSLAGKIARGGLIEVPMGTSLLEIAGKIGGGTGTGKKIKAIQVGGPSGGCIPFDKSGIPVDYEKLVSFGAIMGSGGIIVLDESDCMVDIAKYFLSFTQLESCGKCTFCRIGTKHMLDILERLCAGDATEADIDRLEILSGQVKTGSLCGLGKSAPNPVLSTLKYFRDEYIAHTKGICPAGKCKKLIRYFITEDCIGCTRCARICSETAITSAPYLKHQIDDAKCSRCGNCLQVCHKKAIVVTGK